MTSAEVRITTARTVFAAPGEIVQANAQIADRALLPRHRPRLGDRHQPVARELPPRAPEPRRTRDPDDGLQVAAVDRRIESFMLGAAAHEFARPDLHVGNSELHCNARSRGTIAVECGRSRG